MVNPKHLQRLKRFHHLRSSRILRQVITLTDFLQLVLRVKTLIFHINTSCHWIGHHEHHPVLLEDPLCPQQRKHSTSLSSELRRVPAMLLSFMISSSSSLALVITVPLLPKGFGNKLHQLRCHRHQQLEQRLPEAATAAARRAFLRSPRRP